MINIERNILSSILEYNFIQSEKKILNEILDYRIFIDKHHILFVKSINRLKELDEVVDSDTIRLKLQEVNKWDFYLEQSLLDIMTAQPFSSYKLFKDYLNILEENYKQSKRNKIAMYI